MTRFAFGAKCGKPGRPPIRLNPGTLSLPGSTAPRSRSSRELSAATPRPVADREKNCRRVRKAERSDGEFMVTMIEYTRTRANSSSTIDSTVSARSQGALARHLHQVGRDFSHFTALALEQIDMSHERLPLQAASSV